MRADLPPSEGPLQLCDGPFFYVFLASGARLEHVIPSERSESRDLPDEACESRDLPDEAWESRDLSLLVVIARTKDEAI